MKIWNVDLIIEPSRHNWAEVPVLAICLAGAFALGAFFHPHDLFNQVALTATMSYGALASFAGLSPLKGYRHLVLMAAGLVVTVACSALGYRLSQLI